MKPLKFCTTKAICGRGGELTSLVDWYDAPDYFSGGVVVINHPFIILDKEDFQASYTQFISFRTVKMTKKS